MQGKFSLYSSWKEVQGLIKQVLSRDIRSLSQRQKPRNAVLSALNEQYLNAPIATDTNPLQKALDNAESFDTHKLDQDIMSIPATSSETSTMVEKNEDVEVGLDSNVVEINKVQNNDKVVYHLVLEGIDVAYTLIGDNKVLVEGAALTKVLKPVASHDFDPRNWRHLFSNDT